VIDEESKMSSKKETLVKISASKRDEFGKGASRRARRDGKIPAVIYGKDQTPLHINLEDHEATLALRIPLVTLEVTIDGTTITTAPREVQRDPIKRSIKHVDLVVLNAEQVKARMEDASHAEERAAEEAAARLASAAASVMDLGETAPAGDAAETPAAATAESATASE
jgi:large subunit ribosomal protein L25